MKKILLVSIVVMGMVLASFGQVTKIYDIQYTEDPSGDSPLLDSTVTISGIVVAEHRGAVYANGGISSSYFWVMDSAAAWSGIQVLHSSSVNYAAEGDSITITGVVSEYFGNTQIGDISEYILHTSQNEVYEPLSVTTVDVDSNEAYEGCLVRVTDVTVTEIDLDAYHEFRVSDGSGNLRIDTHAQFYYIAEMDDELASITGVVMYSYEFQIYPRLAWDVVEGGEYTRLQRIQQVRNSDLLRTPVDEVSDISYAATGAEDTTYYTVTGIVTVPTGLSYAGDGIKFVMSEIGGGPWSGILSYAPDSTLYPTLYEGDVIEMTGFIDEYATSPSNMTEFWITSPINILDAGQPLPVPDTIKTGDFRLPVTAEQWGNVTVVVKDATVTDINPPSEPYGMFAVNDGTGEIWVDHDSDSLLTWFNGENVLPVGTIYESIRGWVYHHYGDYADSSTYKIVPSYVSDMVVGSAPPQLTNVVRDPLIPLSSNAVEVSVNVKTNFTIVSVMLNYSVNGGLYQEAGMSLATGNTWSGEIPAQADGSRINYYIKATDDTDGSTLAPSDTSLIQYSYVISDAGLTIGNIQYTTWPLADSPFEGCDVSITGIVTADTASKNEFYAYVIQDGQGPWNGIFLFGAEELLTRGEEVRIWGTVTDYNADYHFKWDNNTMILVDSVEILSSENVINSEPLGSGILADDSPEAEFYEGVQVKVSNAELVSVNSYDVTIDDGSGPCLVDDDMIAYDDFHVERTDKYLYAFGDTIRPGDIIDNIQGVFTYSFGTYKISVRDQNDWGAVVGINPDYKPIPYAYKLQQNFPNPFNPETRIYFEIPQAHDVTIMIYNMLGQQIRTLVKENFKAGQHVVNWNGKNDHGLLVPTGVYIYRIKAGNFIAAKKMVMLK